MAVPGEDEGTPTNAGAFHVFFGVPSTGLQAAGSGDEYISQAEPGVSGNAEAYDEFSERMIRSASANPGYDGLTVTVPGESCGTGDYFAAHSFESSPSGLISETGLIVESLACFDLSAVLSDAESDYLPCLLEEGLCHCSEEMRFMVGENISLDAGVEAWMCLVRAQTALELCEAVPEQLGSSPTLAGADCVEASAEIWEGCAEGTLELDWP